MAQDLENPKVGEVGLGLANLLYMALSLDSAFQSLEKTRRGWGWGVGGKERSWLQNFWVLAHLLC